MIASPQTIAAFVFTAPNRRQGHCRIELIPLADGRTLVIATELATNTGMSITNAAEAVASAVCVRFQIDANRLVWIEHYDNGSYHDRDRAESFDRVEFRHVLAEGKAVLKHPRWSPMTDADWKALGLDPPSTSSVTPACRFSLGRVVITPAALASLNAEDSAAGLVRHAAGDWGDLCAEDRAQNDAALEHGGRLFSAYRDRHGTKFWIITECDRSATTILLPEDY